MTHKEKLQKLVGKYQEAKANGQLDGASEATMRTWIDELLSVFGWNVRNTHQVLTEHTLGKDEKDKLNRIGSTNVRPDYTLVNGEVKLAFVDAKNITVAIQDDKNAAFQIRSYGWSIGASFSIVTNFEELAIYDCSPMPRLADGAAVARIWYFTCDEYVSKFDTLDSFLSRANVISNSIKFLGKKGEALDEKFSALLGDIRKKLACAIVENNEIDNIETLSYYVQTIINRILFVRVCESRGLERDGLLESFTENDFWQEFCRSSYADFYEHYDGPMFKKIQPLQNLTIPNEAFVYFVENLYYPSPYRFDVIPLKSLSDIYDLFLGYQLVVKNGEISDELKTEFKKSNGAVTTPERLVSQVIESTISKTYLEHLSLSEILSLKFVDIACGSGVFLVGLYDYLQKFVEKKLNQGQDFPQKYYVVIGKKAVLTLEGRKAIINQCLYGVDINPEAVEVAKLSLSLKFIDSYQPEDFEIVGMLGSQILKGIGAHIKCGNSLVGKDIETVCPSILNDIKELQATNAFDWEKAFPEVFAVGGFDFVVGNPPYVEVKNYNVGLPSMASYIKSVYASSKNGKIDLAIPFIEKGIGLLNNKGRLGYIVQKRFFKDQYGKGIRKMLTNGEHFLLDGIYDYEETNLFLGRITYVAILVCDNKPSGNKQVWYMNSKDASKNQLMSAATFSEAPWKFESSQLSALRVRLSENLGTLSDVCHVKVGVQVLWNDAFQIVVDRIAQGLIYGHSKVDENVVVEYEACKPLLCNEQFAPLTHREYKTFALFPYRVSDDGQVAEIGMTEFVSLYPNAAAYLMKHKKLICEHVQTLPKKYKEQVKKSKGKSEHKYNDKEHWHLYTRANNHGAVYPKICVPMTAKYPQTAVVLDKHVYCDNANMFFIQVDDVSEMRLYALAGIINSTIFNTFARSVANPQSGGYYKFNKQFLDPIPVPRDAFLKGSKDIVKLASIAKRIEETNEQLKMSIGGQSSGLELSLQSLWKQLDELCLKLYGIKKPEEKALIYSVLRKDRNPYEQED